MARLPENFPDLVEHWTLLPAESDLLADSATVWYDCSGDGRYTYRVVTDGFAVGGVYSQSVQSENYLTVSC